MLIWNVWNHFYSYCHHFSSYFRVTVGYRKKLLAISGTIMSMVFTAIFCKHYKHFYCSHLSNINLVILHLISTNFCKHLRPKRTWKEVVREDCQARKLNKEDAMDRCKWRKVIKEVCWPGWVWAGECFFWYRPTRVVPDERPLNGCCCCCCLPCRGSCCFLMITHDSSFYCFYFLFCSVIL